MDKTPEYIKMCDCPEIQGAQNEYIDYLALYNGNEYAVKEDGDFAYIPQLANNYVYNTAVGGYVWREPSFGCAVDPTRVIDIRNGDVVWLPRQDQLQEMVFTNERDTINVQANRIINQFALVPYGGTSCTATCYLKTWEQLWLAFVMHEKYGKHWNGNTWSTSVVELK
jgi:hypothetical protein